MILGNTGRGGTQSFIMNVLRNINRDQYKVDILVNDDIQGGWGNEMRSLGCNILFFPRFKVYNFLSFYKKLNTFFKDHHYDIVHGHTTNSAGIYLYVAKRYGIKTIAHVHSTGFRGNCFERLFKYLFSRLTKQQADFWFACSNEAAQFLYSEDYKSYNNYYEIPNGIDVHKYRFNSFIRSDIRQQLKISEKTFVCGHVGTFSEPKNHTFLIDVFYEIKKLEEDSKLILIGSGKLKESIIEKTEKLGLQNDIVFLENISNVNEYLIAMDLFIFPSLFEGFGMVSLEAQASGLNVLQTDTIPYDTHVTPNVTVMSLKETPKIWALKATQINGNNREEMNSIVEASKYNIRKTVDLLSSLYVRVLNSN